MFVSQVSATTVRRGLAYTQRFAWARGFSSTTAKADQYDVVVIGRCMFGKWGKTTETPGSDSVI
jgi:hypothetical protein